MAALQKYGFLWQKNNHTKSYPTITTSTRVNAMIDMFSYQSGPREITPIFLSAFEDLPLLEQIKSLPKHLPKLLYRWIL